MSASEFYILFCIVWLRKTSFLCVLINFMTSLTCLSRFRRKQKCTSTTNSFDSKRDYILERFTFCLRTLAFTFVTEFNKNKNSNNNNNNTSRKTKRRRFFQSCQFLYFNVPSTAQGRLRTKFDVWCTPLKVCGQRKGTEHSFYDKNSNDINWRPEKAWRTLLFKQQQQ